MVASTSGSALHIASATSADGGAPGDQVTSGPRSALSSAALRSRAALWTDVSTSMAPLAASGSAAHGVSSGCGLALAAGAGASAATAYCLSRSWIATRTLSMRPGTQAGSSATPWRYLMSSAYPGRCSAPSPSSSTRPRRALHLGHQAHVEAARGVVHETRVGRRRARGLPRAWRRRLAGRRRRRHLRWPDAGGAAPGCPLVSPVDEPPVRPRDAADRVLDLHRLEPAQLLGDDRPHLGERRVVGGRLRLLDAGRGGPARCQPHHQDRPEWLHLPQS